MIDKSPPFKGLNIGIPIIIPIKGRGLINQGSGLLFRVRGSLGHGKLQGRSNGPGLVLNATNIKSTSDLTM